MINMKKNERNTEYRHSISILNDEEQAMLLGTVQQQRRMQMKQKRREYKEHSRLWRLTRLRGTMFEFTVHWVLLMLVWTTTVVVYDHYSSLDDYLLTGKQHRFMATFLAFFVVLFTNQAVSRFEHGLESATQISTAIEQLFVELQGCSVKEDRLVYSECFRLLPPLLTAIRFALGHEDVTKKLKPFVIDEVGKYLYDDELTWVVRGGTPPEPRIEVLQYFKEVMMRRGEESPWSTPLPSPGYKQKFRFPLIFDGGRVIHLLALDVTKDSKVRKQKLQVTLNEGNTYEDIILIKYNYQMVPNSDDGIHALDFFLRDVDGNEELVHIGNLLPSTYADTALARLVHLSWQCNVHNTLPHGTKKELKPTVGQKVTTRGYQLKSSDNNIHFVNEIEGIVEDVTKNKIIINGEKYPFRNVIWEDKSDPVNSVLITLAGVVAMEEITRMNAGLLPVFDMEKSLFEDETNDHEHDYSNDKPWESVSPIERAGFLMSAPRQCRALSYKPLERKEMKIDNIRELPGRVLYLLNRVTINSAGGVSNCSIDNVSQKWLEMKIIAETKYPFPLFHMGPIMTLIWLLTLPFHLLESFEGNQRWAVIILVMVLTIVFVGLLEVGKELINPFGQDLNDIDLAEYEQRLNRELCGLTPISIPTNEKEECDSYGISDFPKSLSASANMHTPY